MNQTQVARYTDRLARLPQEQRAHVAAQARARVTAFEAAGRKPSQRDQVFATLA